MIVTLPPHRGAPAGVSGKSSIRGPPGGTLAAKARRVVVAPFLIGAGSAGSFGEGVCQAPPRRLRSWLPLGAL